MKRVWLMLVMMIVLMNHQLYAQKTITNSIGMKLNLIPAGSFMMGSPEIVSQNDEIPTQGELGRDASEFLHQVTITKPFYMGIHEVTQEQYSKVIKNENGKPATPSHFSATGNGAEAVEGKDTSNFPVENVTWNDAVQFCETLSNLPAEKAAGRVYRLPKEAEWEYACRAPEADMQRKPTVQPPFHYGDSLISNLANFDGDHPYLPLKDVVSGKPDEALKGRDLQRTEEVGKYQPNAFGLFDMHGNVWEWCNDWYSDDYYRESPPNDPKGPAEGMYRVARSGGWFFYGAGCRSASRYKRLPNAPRNTDGFRVVCEVK